MADSIGIKVRSWLCDDLSKIVFDAREEWSVAKGNSLRSIFRYASEYRELIEESIKNFSFLKQCKYAIYGAGYQAGILIEYLRIYNLIENCVAVWDSNSSKWNNEFYGCKISPPLYNDGSVDFVIITPLSWTSANQIIDTLIEKSFIRNQLVALREHFFGQFSQHYDAENKSQYFDKDIIISRLSNNEVFIDAGSESFSTSLQFLELSRDTKKIYVFECSSLNISRVSEAIKTCEFKNVQFEQCALWSSDGQLFFKESPTPEFGTGNGHVSSDKKGSPVQAKALDNIIPTDEIVTFIKMDIEGAEMEALKGAERIIKKDKPKIAISVYHKINDYIEIPAYIKTLVPEYKMYMRHYHISDTETVLYCVL